MPVMPLIHNDNHIGVILDVNGLISHKIIPIQRVTESGEISCLIIQLKDRFNEQ